MEVETATSLFQLASQAEKLGIVALLFLICLVLTWLLRKAVSDKEEVLDALETHRTNIDKILAVDREDRQRLYEKNVEGITKINQSIDEIKNLVKQQQDFSNSVLKYFMEKGSK